jgi:hypothetical protein
LNRSLIHEGEEGQWTCLLDEATNKLKEVNLSNPVTQKMIAGFESLLPVCLARYKDSVKDKWIQTMKDYREMHVTVDAWIEFLVGKAAISSRQTSSWKITTTLLVEMP